MKFSLIMKAIATILPMMTAPAVAGTFSQPGGLALDANGNLYVASQLSNKVVVFDKNFVPQPQLTITAGLDQPISLAIDKTGVIYVGNIGVNARITAYNPNGTQITNRVYPAFRPYALAIGADNVLYDFDNAATLNIYNTMLQPSTLQSINIATQLKRTNGVSAILSNAGLFYVMDGQYLHFASEPEVIAGRITSVGAVGPFGSSSFAMIADNFHNFFITDENNKAVNFVSANLSVATGLINNLPSIPTGIALDKARNRLFVSFPGLNMVNVYKLTYGTNNVATAATLLTTLR